LVFFSGNDDSVLRIVRKYKKLLPPVGYELENLCEELKEKGECIDFSESSLATLDGMVRDVALGESNAVKDSQEVHSFIFRNREAIGRLGTFLGCIVIENIGGRWQREDGGLVVAKTGGANVEFDPYQAVIRAIIDFRNESLESQYRRLGEEIRGRGPMARFRRGVVEEIERRIPGVKVGRISGLELWLTNGIKINLQNLYATCRRSPKSAGEAVGQFVGVVCSMESAGAEMPGFEEAAGSLYPVLKTSAFLKRGLGDGEKVAQQLVWDEFHGVLVVCYVFERDGCFRFVRNGDLEKWSATVEKLHHHAIRNLEVCSLGLDHSIASTRYGSVIVVNANDGYDAARILLPGLRERLSPHLGESFVVAVPCRDLLVAFERNDGLLSFMKRWIRDDAHMGAYGLTDALFVCDGRGMTPLGEDVS